ncbi:MAG: ATP-binding protein [Micropruina sp.]
MVHNHPQRGRVWIATAVDADSVMLTVENTGDVLSSEPVATLTEPFRRGTARVHSDHAHAASTAIVNSVTQAHDGSLTLTPRPGGGLRVTVRLPRAPEAVAAPGTPSGAGPTLPVTTRDRVLDRLDRRWSHRPGLAPGGARLRH